jgi:hypothetical protein
MKRKSRWLEWVRWRWEFMRRDPEYRKAYEEAQGYREAAGFCFGPVVQRPDSVDYSKTPQGREEAKLCERFDLRGLFLIDPDESFEDICEIIKPAYMKNQPKAVEELDPAQLGWLHDNLTSRSVKVTVKRFEEVKRKAKVSFPIRVAFDIDFARVNSIDSLKDYISNLIDWHWDNIRYLEKVEASRPNIHEGSAKATDFDLILKIGSLREENMTYRKIGEEVYQSDTDPESAKKKAQNHAKRYKELTRGGWRILRYP